MTATSTLNVTGIATFNSNVGIGTSSPYAKLSVVGEIVGSYFTATSTTATSTFSKVAITGGAISGLTSLSGASTNSGLLDLNTTLSSDTNLIANNITLTYTGLAKSTQSTALKVLTKLDTGSIHGNNIPTGLWAGLELKGEMGGTSWIGEVRPMVSQMRFMAPAGKTYTTVETALYDGSVTANLAAGTWNASNLVGFFYYPSFASEGAASATLNFTVNSALWAKDVAQGRDVCTPGIDCPTMNLTYNYPILIDTQTAGTNISYIMLGTNGAAPSITGNWALYDNTGYSSYFSKDITVNRDIIVTGKLRHMNQSVTISLGAITASSSDISLDTEASAATDELDTINGGNQSEIIRLRSTNAARDIIIKHETNNIRLKNEKDFRLNRSTDVLVLQLVGANWIEVSRSYTISPVALGTCGTGSSIVGTTRQGNITVGTGSPTSCAVSFTDNWAATPNCTVTSSSTGYITGATASITALTITSSVGMSQNDVLAYICQ